jgi:hypothetical protein
VGDTTWLQSKKPVLFTEAGAYLMTCYARQSLDGIRSNDTLQYVLFVDEAAGSHTLTTQWNLFPNPADDFLHIEAPGLNKPYDLELFDANGRCVLRKTSIKTDYLLDTKIFASGFYTVKLHCEYESTTRSLAICHP